MGSGGRGRGAILARKQKSVFETNSYLVGWDAVITITPEDDPDHPVHVSLTNALVERVHAVDAIDLKLTNRPDGPSTDKLDSTDAKVAAEALEEQRRKDPTRPVQMPTELEQWQPPHVRTAEIDRAEAAAIRAAVTMFVKTAVLRVGAQGALDFQVAEQLDAGLRTSKLRLNFARMRNGGYIILLRVPGPVGGTLEVELKITATPDDEAGSSRRVPPSRRSSTSGPSVRRLERRLRLGSRPWAGQPVRGQVRQLVRRVRTPAELLVRLRAGPAILGQLHRDRRPRRRFPRLRPVPEGLHGARRGPRAGRSLPVAGHVGDARPIPG
jgi:hypothetical protein